MWCFDSQTQAGGGGGVLGTLVSSLFLKSLHAHSCLRAFAALTVPSTWNPFPSDTLITCSCTSFRVLHKMSPSQRPSVTLWLKFNISHSPAPRILSSLCLVFLHSFASMSQAGSFLIYYIVSQSPPERQLSEGRSLHLCLQSLAQRHLLCMYFEQKDKTEVQERDSGEPCPHRKSRGSICVQAFCSQPQSGPVFLLAWDHRFARTG